MRKFKERVDTEWESITPENDPINYREIAKDAVYIFTYNDFGARVDVVRKNNGEVLGGIEYNAVDIDTPREKARRELIKSLIATNRNHEVA